MVRFTKIEGLQTFVKMKLRDCNGPNFKPVWKIVRLELSQASCPDPYMPYDVQIHFEAMYSNMVYACGTNNYHQPQLLGPYLLHASH